MSEHSPNVCKNCGGTIYWHKSKAGKPYPTDSATDRRAFHQCTGTAPTPPPLTPRTMAPAPPAPKQHIEASLEERVTHLERHVRELFKTISRLDSQRPISADDVGF
jgi:hypothetical protein